MLKVLVFTLLAMKPLLSYAQQSVGSRAISMGGASSTLSDVYAYFHNPGAYAEVKGLQFGLTYENKFFLKELQKQSLIASYALKKGTISFGAQYYGYQLYRNYKMGFGYALTLFENFSAGVQINYQGLKIAENILESHKATAELGILYAINKEWKVGFAAYNITQTKWRSSTNEYLPMLFKLGASYNYKKAWIVALDVEKNVAHRLNIRGGIEYAYKEWFFARVGATSNPLSLNFGFGARWNWFQMDLGSSYHQVLSWSPNISFQFDLNKAK
jgi:hypothetical protein